MAVAPLRFICRACRYKQRLNLTGPGRVVVNVGDEVTPADLVGYIVERGPIGIIDVAAKLHIAPKLCQDYLTIKEGQSVRAGEVLARHKGMLRTFEVRTPVDSRAMAVGAGMIVLEGFPTEKPLRGSMPGRVSEVYPGEGLLIDGRGTVISLSRLLGNEFGGPLKVLSVAAQQRLRPDHVDATCHGAVIVAGYADDMAALARAAEFGAQGAILGSVPAAWVKEKLPIPVALVEGFGAMPINQLAQTLFGEQALKLVYVLHRGDQVWAVVPQRFDEYKEIGETVLGAIRPGMLARVAAGQHTGSIGTVVDFAAAGAEVILKLERERLTVPTSNIEIIIQ